MRCLSDISTPLNKNAMTQIRYPKVTDNNIFQKNIHLTGGGI